MSIIVSKFGGSSTANAGMFLKLRKIIMEHPERRYIILSAPGTGEGCPDKITNLLYRCYKLHASGSDFSSVLKKITGRFSEISSALSLPDISRLAEKEITDALRISADHTASRGEYLCALLFSRWTGIPMVDADGIIRFRKDGSLDDACTRTAISDMKARYPRAVIPGFYGALPDGRIHTFPRNGSDITGALVAAGAGAILYENWSDVDGFMTADPALVPDARFNPNISYRQMRSLSQEGAQILHPDCLSPVSKAAIPTLLKNTNRPDGPGTLISDSFTCPVPCVTGTRGIACIPTDHPFMKYLPENISYRCHEDKTGSAFILAAAGTLPQKLQNLSVHACISVFGASDRIMELIIAAVKPVAYFTEEDHTKLIVPEKALSGSIRTAHSLLMDGC